MLTRTGFLALLGLLVTTASAAEAPRGEPQYVLLRDLAVLRGTVDEEPSRIIIRQSAGSELRLPRDRVVCWAPSLEGLYQYQVDQRGRITLESHLDLAQWCIRNRYFAGAAIEILAAHQLSPGDERIALLERQLRLAVEAATEQESTEPEADATDGAGKGDREEQVSGTGDASSPVTYAPAPEVDSPAFRQFVTHIQPLLLNQCGACHRADSSAAFRLVAPGGGHGRPTARMTQENLEAVVRWIDRERPDASPLLVRAVEVHGDLHEPPLGPRHAEAIENLRRWTLQIAAGRDRLAGSESPPATTPGEIVSTPAMASGPLPSPDIPTPVRLPPLEDPFDPDLFNRRYHGM